MAQYQYTPLTEPNTIRLLHLFPNADESAPLEASFEVISLPSSSCSPSCSTSPPPDIPAFEALSYVWGSSPPSSSPTPNCTIRIYNHDHHQPSGNARDLPIPTSNLTTALRRFRHTSTPRLLWADAICINQCDLSERNAQVQIMADIFRAATTTLGWLGDGSADEQEALRKLVEIADAAPRYGAQARGPGPWRPGRFIADELDLESLTGDPAEIVAIAVQSGAEEVLGREWFGRLWIVQEVVLARRAMLCLGEAEVDWEVVEAVALLLYRAATRAKTETASLANSAPKGQRKWFRKRFEEAKAVKMAVKNAVDISVERQEQDLFRKPEGVDTSLLTTRSVLGVNSIHIQAFSQLTQRGVGSYSSGAMSLDRPQRFMSLLWELRHRHCGDDRDRIYATRSLVPWDMPLNVPVDYSRSVIEVYTSFTREVLDVGISDILLDKELDEAPSWVCEFRLSKLKGHDACPWRHPFFESGPSSVAKLGLQGVRWPVTDPSPRRIEILSSILDDIADVSYFPPRGLESRNDQLLHLRICLAERFSIFRLARFPDLDSDSSPTFEQMAEFALVVGLDANKYRSAVFKLAHFVVEGRKWIDTMAALAGRSVRQLWTFDAALMGPVSKEADDDVFSLFSRMMMGSTFFRTASGNVGFGPAMVSVEDKVARFTLLSTPTCVLRQVVGSNDHWLIGICYMQGFVDEPPRVHQWVSLV
ncbi:heterokaryon incompatibility protein-domain-containing protein [Triangularia verruculosa]|uniref:Heterokaryon incompatibility protein-domain-containing protein n=1 Tax=Triangularia verruculosa TaxID=2587418 RepID=A0AAN7ATE2_9PEZI|nr:heterokaryon incompatibility protein-domain-containing protein [Triangularia verruculosa]